MRPNKMSKKAIIIAAVGVIVGAIAGYAYYHYVGCASGTCAITSKPLNSTLYGALMGGLLFNLFVKENKNK
ncbi:hypothetical protein GCM10022389_21340 [Flavobacterium cheonanense]|uniref:YtxH domain-containing protein n=2 Tax=Flavobacterium cheonanense TaxID=706183 RepID=A0ABP7VWA2_9FLAO